MRPVPGADAAMEQNGPIALPMMGASWTFNQLPPGGMRDSLATSENLGGSNARKVVREILQNTLDAGVATPVCCAITIRELDPTVVRSLFRGSEMHWREAGFPLGYMLNEPVRTLLVEDFGTTGLGGPVATPDPRSPFVNFFRALGSSTKTRGEGGSHGIGGRAALAGASRGGCFFGFTRRREDGRALAFGQAHLRAHTLEDGIDAPVFDKYGFYAKGWCYTGQRSGYYEPLEGYEAEAVAQSLGVQRGPKDWGCSLIVPFLRDDIVIRGDARDGIEDAVIDNFFHDIQRGDLEVAIHD